MTYVSEALQALSGVNDLEAISNGLVHLGVGLKNQRVSIRYLLRTRLYDQRPIRK